ncbi:MAG TPA: gas vesicle protein GvpG [Solirubrobacteraceae bacterium]|jgi:hypothetical protein
MGLLTLPLRLPLLPLRGVIRLGELIGDEAERQLNDPARIRRELEEAQRLWAAGEITDEELARIEEEITAQLVRPAVPETASRTTGGERHG